MSAALVLWRGLDDIWWSRLQQLKAHPLLPRRGPRRNGALLAIGHQGTVDSVPGCPSHLDIVKTDAVRNNALQWLKNLNLDLPQCENSCVCRQTMLLGF